MKGDDMRRIFVGLFFSPFFVLTLTAEDIRDNRPSAVTAAQECKKIVSSAEQTLSKLSGAAPVGTVIRQIASGIQTEVAKKYPAANPPANESPAPEVTLTPEDRKLQEEIQKKLNANLQELQNKSSSLKIPGADSQNVEQIKAKIAEDINSTESTAGDKSATQPK